MSGTECFGCAPGSHHVCAIRTPLGVDWKHYSIRSKAIQVVCNNANALLILPHIENKCILYFHFTVDHFSYVVIDILCVCALLLDNSTYTCLFRML